MYTYRCNIFKYGYHQLVRNTYISDHPPYLNAIIWVLLLWQYFVKVSRATLFFDVDKRTTVSCIIISCKPQILLFLAFTHPQVGFIRTVSTSLIVSHSWRFFFHFNSRFDCCTILLSTILYSFPITFWWVATRTTPKSCSDGCFTTLCNPEKRMIPKTTSHRLRKQDFVGNTQMKTHPFNFWIQIVFADVSLLLAHQRNPKRVKNRHINTPITNKWFSDVWRTSCTTTQQFLKKFVSFFP